MKSETFKRSWPVLRQTALRPGSRFAAALTALWLTVVTLSAAPIVDTISGGPSQFNPSFSGYVDGDTANLAQFHTPYALALDSSGGFLYVADRDNNAVRLLDLAGNQTYTFVPNASVPASLIAQPVGVALDGAGNVYVLNRGSGNNGTVLKFDTFGELVATNATALINAAGIALDSMGNIYLTVKSNTVMRISPGGTMTTIAMIANAGTSLQGLIVKHDGRIAACDSGRHGIYLIDPASGLVTTNAGFHGAGDFTSANNVASSSTAKFNQPYGVAEAGGGILVVADYGNHRVKVVLPSGVVTNLYGVSSSLWYTGSGALPGWWDGTVVVPDSLGGVEARQPVGVIFASDGTVYTTEVYYHLIRKVTSTGLPAPPPPAPEAPIILTVTTNFGQVTLTWSAVAGATNYIVKRSTSSGGPYVTVANTTATSFTDTGLINGRTYYYVVSASNAGGEGLISIEVNATPPLPPVPDPQIGYVDFPASTFPTYTSVFHPVSSYDFYNDATIVIKGTPGSGTYYTYGYTTNASLVPNPTPASASIPSDYQDGLFRNQISPYTVSQSAPFLSVKAMGAKGDGSPNSAVVVSTFQFKTGNPNISGDNAAQFFISDITDHAHLYYTLDGSDPSSTNGFDLGTVATPTNVWTVSFPITTNTLFKVRAFRDNYQPSAVVSTTFSATNFLANNISFGFASGEASSKFIASPGQLFYAPVTLSILPNVKMYSLQFNLAVTNAGPNPGPPVALGAVGFQSFLEKPLPDDPTIFELIPPLSFSGYQSDPPPASAIIYYDGLPFVDMTFLDTNQNFNLLGVGWLERRGKTNLYDTKAQDLIKYSQPHDTQFLEDNGRVVVGGYAFQVPGCATNGQTYRIQIGRPSATADGIGAPGSDVYIATPTNGSLTAGAINAIKIVTTGQTNYIVGDVYPFGWFNAGDFGKGYLANADVLQVFQSAIYSLNYPPFGSDFFDGMDSCGFTYVDLHHGYLEADKLLMGPGDLNPLFDGNDTNINQIAFGDGTLDVCDVYVTFRRSLDPSLVWFRRFWTNIGCTTFRAAEIVGNVPLPGRLGRVASTNPPAANFASADFVAAAGQTLQIPITAQISGAYPLRKLMLNLSVNALDGSPPLTSPVQFTPNPALGQPTVTDSKGNANYAATWLNGSTPGLTGNATLGTLTVQVPANAAASAAYAVHFDHASASPNGLASFPKQTQTGLIMRSDRSASSWNDGIPDSWRLRYFGSINNLLSAATADADGDGATNWQEYKAGTDPNDAASVLRLRSSRSQTQDFVIRWPSVANKQYVIERTSSLSVPTWTSISTNTGTGLDIEFHDSSNGSAMRFYRVRPLQ